MLRGNRLHLSWRKSVCMQCSADTKSVLKIGPCLLLQATNTGREENSSVHVSQITTTVVRSFSHRREHPT